MQCPFTEEDVNKIDPLLHAIPYNFEQSPPACGHECHLPSLVSYLHNSKNNTNTSASASKTNSGSLFGIKITDIYDDISNCVMLSKRSTRTGTCISDKNAADNANSHVDNTLASYDLISFKYAKQNYHLAVRAPISRKVKQQKKSFLQSIAYYIIPQSLYGSAGSDSDNANPNHTKIAQDRIAHVLDMEMSNMKILFKGKVLFPIKDDMTTPDELSRRLVEICTQDKCTQHAGYEEGKGKKKQKHNPSLTVIGTRKSDMEKARQFVDEEDARRKNNRFTGSTGMMFFVHKSIFSIVHGAKVVINFSLLWFKTILFPNAQIDDHQE